MKRIIIKYKPFVSYLFFGALTTIINISCYAFFFKVLLLSNVVSNILAWIISVLFAFITNKLWVFGSKSLSKKKILAEISAFFLCRISTGVFDLAVMYISVDVFRYDAIIMKVSANIAVIILNYAASKFIIFKKK